MTDTKGDVRHLGEDTAEYDHGVGEIRGGIIRGGRARMELVEFRNV